MNSKDEIKIIDVAIVPSSKINSGWKGTLQLVETSKGVFIDNAVEQTYVLNQRENDRMLGHNWKLEIGNTLTFEEYKLVKYSRRIWIKKI